MEAIDERYGWNMTPVRVDIGYREEDQKLVIETPFFNVYIYHINNNYSLGYEIEGFGEIIRYKDGEILETQKDVLENFQDFMREALKELNMENKWAAYLTMLKLTGETFRPTNDLEKIEAFLMEQETVSNVEAGQNFFNFEIWDYNYTIVANDNGTFSIEVFLFPSIMFYGRDLLTETSHWLGNEGDTYTIKSDLTADQMIDTIKWLIKIGEN